MSENWWPTPLAHIPREDPWADEHVVVAEIKSFDEQPHAGYRTTIAALVPIEQLDAIKKALAKLDHEVSTSGPHPYYAEDHPFKPAFWIEAKRFDIGAGEIASGCGKIRDRIYDVLAAELRKVTAKIAAAV
jgi:hypothetical protein